jgi:hypothetical protein
MRRARPRGGAVSAFNPEDAAPATEMPPGFRATLAVLVGMAAILASACAWIQADASRKQSDALITGARQAVELLRKITASQIQLGASDGPLQLADYLDTRAGLERDLHRAGLAPGADALARADQDTAMRLADSFGGAADPAGAKRLLDAATAEALGTSVFRLGPRLREQNESIALAERQSTRQSRASFALALTALAAALLGLAGLLGAVLAGRVALVTAGLGLLLALGWAWAAVLA